METVCGVALNDMQRNFYHALGSNTMKKRFLSDIKKKTAQNKVIKTDSVIQLKSEAVDIENLYKIENLGLQTFSIGCLDGYFYLSDLIEKSFLYRGRVLVMPSRKGGFRAFVFKYLPEDVSAISELLNHGGIYSPTPIKELPQSPSIWRETRYHIPTVLNPDSYLNSKKRHKRLKQPEIYLKQCEVETVSQSNINECLELHDKWVEYKLADPKTTRILFPGKRYSRCTQKVLTDPIFKGFAFRIKGKIEAVRVISIENGFAYGLAKYGNRWSPQLKKIIHAVDFFIFKYLDSLNIQYFNVGMGINKGHKEHKDRYPHQEVILYAYYKKK